MVSLNSKTTIHNRHRVISLWNVLSKHIRDCHNCGYIAWQIVGEYVGVRCHYNNSIHDFPLYLSRLDIYGMYTCHMVCIHVICYVYMSYAMYTCHMLCIHVICYVYKSYVMYTCHMVCIHVFVLIIITRRILGKSVRIHYQYKKGK